MSSPLEVGWREWLTLPALDVQWLKAKIDTGARTSALNAQEITLFQRDQTDWVRFKLHPVQEQETPQIVCEAPVVEYRHVTDSGGNTDVNLFSADRLRGSEHPRAAFIVCWCRWGPR